MLSREEIIEIRKSIKFSGTAPWSDTIAFAEAIQKALVSKIGTKILDIFDEDDEDDEDALPVPKPVMKDGQLENFLLTVNGKKFRCSCGCNVFHKPDDTKLARYKCNGCNKIYE